MRHSKTFNHLGRTRSHRKSMMANMASSLILHKRITTTVAKAKALKTFVEPLITKSKEDSTHSRRVAFSYLKDKTAVSELFREISVKVADRPGGYTRILRTGNRLGDNAEMCILELVDYNEAMLGIADTGKAKTGRKRRSSKKKAAVPVVEKAQPAEKPEETIEDAETTSKEAISEKATTGEDTSSEEKTSEEITPEVIASEETTSEEAATKEEAPEKTEPEEPKPENPESEEKKESE